jgi:nucleoside-diphosphate-sugar epimerase
MNKREFAFRLLTICMILIATPSFAGTCSSEGEPTFDSDSKPLVLVTGGAGFIGSHLVDILLEAKLRVRVLDDFVTGSLRFLDLGNPDLEVLEGSIEDVDFVKEAMEGVGAVFHLAAASKVAPSLKDPSNASFNVQVNAGGTANVLEAAASSGSVKRVIYAASSTYYGNQETPFTESDRFVPSSPYAASKYMGELLCSTYDKVFNLACVSLRFFMVYGPRQPSTGAYAIVTGKFIDQLNAGEPLTIEGSGEQFRDFIHVFDVVDAMMKAYHSNVRGVTINVGSGQKISIKGVADLVSPNQIHIAPRPHDLKGTLANTTLAESILGFKAVRHFKTEMSKLINSTADSHLHAFWKSEPVLTKLEAVIPGFRILSVRDQEARLRALGTSKIFALVSIIE